MLTGLSQLKAGGPRLRGWGPERPGAEYRGDRVMATTEGSRSGI